MSKSFVILGGSGFVGRNLAAFFRQHGEVETPPRGDLFRLPDVIINCVGYKDVAGCERDMARTFCANTVDPHAIAASLGSFRAKFIHISSDHCESTPHTAYSTSKYAGERLILDANPSALIVRTGHVYGKDCPWIAWLASEFARGDRMIEAWSDIYCRPTYVVNLGEMLLDLIENPPATRLVTCVGSQRVNRLELFSAYADAFGQNKGLLSGVRGVAPWHYPRQMVWPNLYAGKVHADSVVEGFERMRKELA